VGCERPLDGSEGAARALLYSRAFARRRTSGEGVARRGGAALTRLAAGLARTRTLRRRARGKVVVKRGAPRGVARVRMAVLPCVVGPPTAPRAGLAAGAEDERLRTEVALLTGVLELKDSRMARSSRGSVRA